MLAVGAIASLTVSCGKVAHNNDAGATGLDSSSVSADMFELDYRGIKSNFGSGIPSGYHYHHAFSIDLQRQLRSYDKRPTTPPVDLVAMYDFGTCESRSGEEFSQSASSLSPGQSSAWLDYVELEFSTEAKTFTSKDGACFGVRRPGGAWEWHFDIVPLVPAGAGRARVRLPVQLDGVDGVKIAFSKTVQPMFCETVRFRALPKRP